MSFKFIKKFHLRDVNTSYLILANQIAKTLTQFALTIILSRYLPPAVYGFYALALVFVVFIEIFRDFGFSNLAMQRPQTQVSDFNQNFWTLAIRGAFLSLAMLLGSILFLFLGRDTVPIELVTNLIILSFIPFLAGISASYNIEIWNREHFSLAIGSDFIAFIVSANLSFVFLFLNWTSTILPLQLVSYHLILIASRVYRTKNFPSSRIPLGTVQNLYSTTPFLGLLNLLKAAVANYDSVIIGFLVGANSLGLYNRAFQISQVPIQQALESQTYLVIQRARFDDKIKVVNEVHLKISIAIIFLLTSVAFNSQKLIDLLYGGTWSESAPPLVYLSIVGIIRVLDFKIYWILLASQEHKLLLKINVFQQLSMVGGMTFGIFYGVKGLCVGLLATVFIGFFTQLLFILKRRLIDSIKIFGNDFEALIIAFSINLAFVVSRDLINVNINIFYCLQILILALSYICYQKYIILNSKFIIK